MQVLILLGLIVLNGLFAMAEIALVTARKARLQKYLDEGDRAAAAALALGEHPTRFLSTIQIGITSIGVLNGVFGEAALAQPMAQWLQAHAGLSASTASTVGTAVAVVGITYLSIVIGELVPKRLGQSNPRGHRPAGGPPDSVAGADDAAFRGLALAFYPRRAAPAGRARDGGAGGHRGRNPRGFGRGHHLRRD